MISFEESGRILDEAVDSLPKEIFRELNGGVNLIPRKQTDEHGLLVMGTYNVNQMGRYVEIYYGSFSAMYPHASPEKCAHELVRTLKHELTHHIESLAMDRSLEKWDEQHVAELLAGLDDTEDLDPIFISSILFVDGSGCGLSEMACAMFRRAANYRGLDDISSACASLRAGAISIKAAKAASRYDVSLSDAGEHLELTHEVCTEYDAVMCTTDHVVTSLAARWPDLEDRFMCIGETDFDEPRFDSQMSWNRISDNMAREINLLIDELMAGDEDND